jgi:hypothetical protein
MLFPPSELLTILLSISWSLEAYGRIWMMASWARRNLAALTIFIAFVICWVDCTDLIRFLTSFNWPAIEVQICGKVMKRFSMLEVRVELANPGLVNLP